MAQNVIVEPANNMSEATPLTLTPNLHPPATEVMISAASTLAPSIDTDETIDAGSGQFTAEPSGASAPSIADSINIDPTPAVVGSVPNSASVSSTSAAAAAAAALTWANISIHNMVHSPDKQIHVHERLWAKQPGRSTVVSSTLPPEQASTHDSDMTFDLGEPFAPMSGDPQDSNVFAIGAWADVERPPM